MKLTKSILREHKIHNPYNLARKAKNRIYIGYSPADYGRAGQPAHWTVVGIDFSTDPEGHWKDYGNKTFALWGREYKQKSLEEAIQWANENFGTNEWEKAPFNSYQIKGTLARIEAMIKEQGNDNGQNSKSRE